MPAPQPLASLPAVGPVPPSADAFVGQFPRPSSRASPREWLPVPCQPPSRLHKAFRILFQRVVWSVEPLLPQCQQAARHIRPRQRRAGRFTQCGMQVLNGNSATHGSTDKRVARCRPFSPWILRAIEALQDLPASLTICSGSRVCRREGLPACSLSRVIMVRMRGLSDVGSAICRLRLSPSQCIKQGLRRHCDSHVCRH